MTWINRRGDPLEFVSEGHAISEGAGQWFVYRLSPPEVGPWHKLEGGVVDSQGIHHDAWIYSDTFLKLEIHARLVAQIDEASHRRKNANAS